MSPARHNELIYLASPYTHPQPSVMDLRYMYACQYVAAMMRAGLHVYSPIAHCHGPAVCSRLPRDFSFWRDYNETMISRCTSFWVLMLDGFKASVGIKGEIEIARQHDLFPVYVQPDEAPSEVLARVA